MLKPHVDTLVQWRNWVSESVCGGGGHSDIADLFRKNVDLFFAMISRFSLRDIIVCAIAVIEGAKRLS